MVSKIPRTVAPFWLTATGAPMPAAALRHCANTSAMPRPSCHSDEGLDPGVAQRFEDVFGCASHTQFDKAGSGIGQTLRRRNRIDTNANRNGVTTVIEFLRFEQDAGELGAIGQHVIGPFERDTGRFVASHAIGTVDAES